MRPPQWRADLALASVALIWGSTFVLVKSALEDISTVLFLALRFSMAAIALSGILVLRQKHRQEPRRWMAGLVTGAFLYLGFLLQTLGLRFTTAAKSGFITGLYIVVVPLLSAIVYRKAPGISEWLGVTAATAGMGLMTLNASSFQIGKGDLLTLGCAFAFAIHILVLGHNAPRMDSDWLALLQVSACAGIALSTFWWLEEPVFRWSSTLWAALAVTSILATTVAFWIQTWAQKYTSATRAALDFALEPVFAWLTSFLVANEILSGRAIAGAACILGGILLVELKPIQSRFHPSERPPVS
jgi:drug/metabolite transporter (DMT)-like permease